MTRKKTATSRNAKKKAASKKGSPFPRGGAGKKRGADAHASAPCHFGAPFYRRVTLAVDDVDMCGSSSIGSPLYPAHAT
jgi:hypothetical protein